MNETASSPRWRRPLLELTSGAVIGFAGWSLAGPGVVSWWYEPPSKDAFSCAGSVKTALGQFVMLQLICAGVGALLIWLTLVLTRRALRKRREARSVPSA